MPSTQDQSVPSADASPSSRCQALCQNSRIAEMA